MKRNFVDVLKVTSRLPFVRDYRREWTEFIADNSDTFETAEICLDIKRKYRVRGKMTPKKCLDIIFKENGYIDDDISRQNLKQPDFYTAELADETRTKVFWLNPNLTLERAFHYMFVSLAILLMPEYYDFYYNSETFTCDTEEELLKHPEWTRVFIKTDILAALLQSDETYAELQKMIEAQPKPEPVRQTLDLSEYSENLNITAKQFSAVINNPNLPSDFKQVLDEFCEVKQ